MGIASLSTFRAGLHPTRPTRPTRTTRLTRPMGPTRARSPKRSRSGRTMPFSSLRRQRAGGERLLELVRGPGRLHRRHVAHADEVRSRIGEVVERGVAYDLVVHHPDRIVAPAPVLLADQRLNAPVAHIGERLRDG